MRQLSADDLCSELERHYEFYRQRIERRLVRRVYDKERADDICQATFLRAWDCFLRQGTNLPQTDEHLAYWLCSIAERIAIDEYRHTQKFELLHLPDDEAYTPFDALTVEGHEAGTHDRLWLQEALAQLPPKQRVSLVMQLSGYKEKQIAAALDISPSAVSMNVHRAKTELHQKYFPVTIDLQRAEASNAELVMLSILEGAIGVINSDKLMEYKERALDWHYRQYMKKHINELRDDLIVNDPTLQARYAHEAKRAGKNCWRELLITEDKKSPFFGCGTFGKRGRLYSDP